MKTLTILNDAPYGGERTYNGLRLAGSLARQGAELRVFLISDAVACAKTGQEVASGYYNTQNMLGAVIRHGGTVPQGSRTLRRTFRRRKFETSPFSPSPLTTSPRVSMTCSSSSALCAASVGRTVMGSSVRWARS